MSRMRRIAAALLVATLGACAQTGPGPAPLSGTTLHWIDEPVLGGRIAVHEAGALLVVQADPVMLAVLRSPGSPGADIVTAEGQPFGNGPSLGRPAAGPFMSVEAAMVSQ